MRRDIAQVRHGEQACGSIRPSTADNMPNCLAIGSACVKEGCIKARGTWKIRTDAGGDFVTFPGLRIGKEKQYFERRPIGSGRK